MKKVKNIFSLQLFAEGEGEGSNEPAPAQQEGTKAEPSAQPEAGKGEGQSAADEGEEFDALIRGKYKEAFDKRVEKILSRRMRNAGNRIENYQKLDGAVEILARRYGMDTAEGVDYDKLAKAVQEDESFLEAEAATRGMETDTLREVRQLELKNRALEKKTVQLERMERERAAIAKMEEQAEKARETYPGLDLRQEMENPMFGRLMAAGLDVKQAYEAIHREELAAQMMAYAAQRSSEQLSQNLQANRNRPDENGVGQGQPALLKGSRTLTREQREEIKARVRRGERIEDPYAFS